MFCEHCGQGPTCGVCGRNEATPLLRFRVVRGPSKGLSIWAKTEADAAYIAGENNQIGPDRTLQPSAN